MKKNEMLNEFQGELDYLINTAVTGDDFDLLKDVIQGFEYASAEQVNLSAYMRERFDDLLRTNEEAALFYMGYIRRLYLDK